MPPSDTAFARQTNPKCDFSRRIKASTGHHQRVYAPGPLWRDTCDFRFRSLATSREKSKSCGKLTATHRDTALTKIALGDFLRITFDVSFGQHEISERPVPVTGCNL